MALIKLGPVAAQASGRIGGVEFAQARAVTVAKKAQHKLRRPSEPAVNRRALVSIVQGRWDALSAADRLLWETAAQANPRPNRLGQVRTYTGYHLFLAVQMNPIDPSHPSGTKPNPNLGPPGAPTITLDFDAANYNLLWTQFPVGFSQTRANIFAWAGATGAPILRPKFWRVLGQFTLTGLSGTTDVKTEWEAALGPLQDGRAFAVRVRTWADGALGGRFVYASDTFTP